VRFAQPSFADGPGRARIACVGAATAQAARRFGWRVDALPAERALPEELALEMARAGSLRAARVLFPRAARAREALVEVLESHGAEVR